MTRQLLEGAIEEISAAEAYYNEIAPDLGKEFILELTWILGHVTAHPEGWPVVYRDVRRHLLSRFPYAVIYRFEGEILTIVAVAHQNRNPFYWHNRL